MAQRLFKGRTNNHLTWVMVDSTDFATPESAMSAATKIKIYGKVRAATGVNFVSSGTGSLTNDIQHVGASALGIYTIALAKADLSDASAAWYDQYVISLSATGAAYQTIIAEGVIDDSNLSGVVSDIYSALVALSDATSNAYSAALQANSRVLLVQSRLSDLDSRLASDLSDVLSGITALSDATSNAYSAAAQANSRVLLNQSRISDIASYLVVMSGIQSDIYSALSDLQSDFQSRVPKAVATNSQLSDLASDVKSAVLLTQSLASDAHSAAAQANSRVLLVQSHASDIRSGMQLLQSAFIAHTGSTASQVTDASVLEIDGIDHDDQFNGYYLRVMGGSQVDELRLIVDTDFTNSKVVVKPAFNSRLQSGVGFIILPGNPYQSRIHSDVRSYLVGLSGLVSDVQSGVLVTQSMASDAASAAQQTNSRVLLNLSRISDTYSLLSDLQSDFQSRVPKRVATDSQLSDVHSDLKSAIGAITVTISASDVSDIASAVVAALPIGSQVSDIYSLLSDFYSDFGSRVPKLVATNSQLSDLASDVKSAVLLTQSMASDAASAAQQANSRVLLVQSQASDTYSLLSDHHSDFQSRVPKRVATDSQLSDVHSDLASKIGAIAATVSASDISDIASAVWAHTVGTRVDSRVTLNLSRVSDTYSLLSDFNSEFLSRVPKRVATDSQLSDVHSDLKSAIGNITVTIGASDVSDIASAVVAALPIASQVSDIYSMLSDFYSDFQSRVPKRVATDSQLSDLASDIKSAVLLTQSMASDAASAAQQANSRVLLNQSRISDTYSLLSDLQSDFQSRVPKRVATDSQLSDVHSDLKSAIGNVTVSVGASDISDIASAVWANTIGARVDSRVTLNLSRISDTYSMLSDLQSDFGSRVPKRVATDSQLSDLHSDLRSFATANQSAVSDIYSLLSDLHSDVGVMSGVLSDTYSLLSDAHSDLKSTITATELDASDLSDIASAVWAAGRTEPTTVVSPTGTVKEGLEWLVALSRNKITQTATIQSLRNDADSADIASAAVSDDGTTFTRNEFGN